MKKFSSIDLRGVAFAVNIFIAGTLLWVILKQHPKLQPIWGISSMIAASDPKLEEATKFFRGRLLNALIGCATGLFVLFVGGSSDWKVPIGLSLSVLVSTYVVHVPVMWRQAPLTATIVVAGGLGDHSKIHGLEHGLMRVGEVLLGCVVGLVVSMVMSKFWRETAQDRMPVV